MRRCHVTAAGYSERHPHEPEIPPVLDAEGRCLICLIAHADELVSQAHDVMWAAYPEWEGENGRREPLNAAMWKLHDLLRGPLNA